MYMKLMDQGADSLDDFWLISARGHTVDQIIVRVFAIVPHVVVAQIEIVVHGVVFVGI